MPSTVFGILDRAIFVNFARLPQSAPVVVGLVPTLMTLPLLLIGMVAFVRDSPGSPIEGGPSDPATALPVQVSD